MILSLIKSPKIDQHGRLFVLIGRVTASAAQNFVNQLERNTESVLIGEPTAQNPAFYSDGNIVTLPNSGIQAFMAGIWSQPADSRDNRPFAAPDVTAETSSSDFYNGRDPAMEAVLAYSYAEKRPLRIVAIARRLGARVAGDSLRAAGAAGLDKYRNLSRDMIRFSFDDLWPNGKSSEALLLLEANAFAYPGDWNSHDALAGAYENLGRFQDALVEYEKALALNPDHRGVKDGIARVRRKIA
jgi:tetratricopeptide (TPR) repeat protein